MANSRFSEAEVNLARLSSWLSLEGSSVQRLSEELFHRLESSKDDEMMSRTLILRHLKVAHIFALLDIRFLQESI